VREEGSELSNKFTGMLLEKSIMLYRLKYLTLTILVFSITFPVRATELSNNSNRRISSTPTAQTQTTETLKGKLEPLYELSVQLFKQNKFKEALQSFTVVLKLAKMTGDRLLCPVTKNVETLN
jgi:hypothetical protein